MLEWLLGLPPERFANGHVEVAMPTGTALMLLAGLALGVWWGLRYAGLGASVNARALAGARFVLLATLLFILLDPHLVTPSRESRDGGVAVIADTSASMQLPHDASGSRFDRLLAVAGPGNSTLTDALEARYSVRHVQAGQRAVAWTEGERPVPLAGTTDLAGAIDTVLASGAPPAAVVFASDGGLRVDSDTRRALLRLKAAGIALHTIDVGGTAPSPDVEVGVVDAPRRVLRGGEVRVAAPIVHRGLDGQAVEVRLEEDGLLIGSRTVTLQADRPAQAEFTYTAAIEGTRRLTVRVAALDGETVTSNNARVALVEVHDGQLDVLHFEAEPRFEVKFARRALGPDESLRLASVIRTAENKFYRLGVRSADDMMDGFPSDPKDLFHYEVIVIGSVGADDLGERQREALRVFVERRGGGVLFLGGRRALGEGGLAGTSLEPLLPVRLTEPEPAFRQRFSLVPTSVGQRHPIAALSGGLAGTAPFSDMPPLTFINPVRDLRPGATLLLGTADADGEQAGFVGLAYQRFGRGTVAVMPVRDLWRWQMHSSVPLEDETHERTWRQLVRWLGSAATERLEVSAWPQVVAPGESIEIEVQALDTAWLPLGAERLSLSTLYPGGEVAIVAPQWESLGEGLYRTRIPARGEGLLGITVTAEEGDGTDRRVSTSVEVSELGTEMAAVGTGSATLAALAEQTGGQALDAADAARLVDFVQPRPVLHASIERLPLWNMPLLLIIALLAVSAEWLLRRHRGAA